jgi:hypothetical protein
MRNRAFPLFRLTEQCGNRALGTMVSIAARSVNLSIRREAIEQPCTAGALKPFLATVARGVRRVPRSGRWVVGEAGSVAVPEHGGTAGARSPILTGHVFVRRECLTVRLRSGQYVVHVGCVAAAVDHRAVLGQCGLFGEHVRAMQFVEVARDERSLGIVPGPMPDAVAGVDGGRSGDRLRAQIGVPGAPTRSNRRGEGLAVRIGAGEPAQIAALAGAGAGKEKAHAFWCVLRLGGRKSEQYKCNRSEKE